MPAPGRRRATWGARRPGSRFSTAQGLIAAVAVLVALPTAAAAFSSVTGNAGNSFAANATFPTYPAVVTADTPLLQHRGEDARSAAATPTSEYFAGSIDEVAIWHSQLSDPQAIQYHANH